MPGDLAQFDQTGAMVFGADGGMVAASEGQPCCCGGTCGCVRGTVCRPDQFGEFPEAPECLDCEHPIRQCNCGSEYEWEWTGGTTGTEYALWGPPGIPCPDPNNPDPCSRLYCGGNVASTSSSSWTIRGRAKRMSEPDGHGGVRCWLRVTITYHEFRGYWEKMIGVCACPDEPIEDRRFPYFGPIYAPDELEYDAPDHGDDMDQSEFHGMLSCGRARFSILPHSPNATGWLPIPEPRVAPYGIGGRTVFRTCGGIPHGDGSAAGNHAGIRFQPEPRPEMVGNQFPFDCPWDYSTDGPGRTIYQLAKGFVSADCGGGVASSRIRIMRRFDGVAGDKMQWQGTYGSLWRFNTLTECGDSGPGKPPFGGPVADGPAQPDTPGEPR